jgi:phosphatidylserine/phosphatidylglycerophosphate/cardiolipin synthase-like enzyme
MRTACLSLALFFVACAPDEEPPEEGTLGLAADEGSPEAVGMLAVANGATYRDLVDEDRVNMSARSAKNLVAYRSGADGLAGTADDRRFQTVAEIDGVYWVGKVALGRLLDFARAEGLVGPAACAVDAPRARPTSFYVFPEDGVEAVLELLESATDTIDVVIYALDNERVEAALAAAVDRGVSVRVLLDRQRWRAAEKVAELVAAGIDCRLSSERFVYTHQKTIVVDHRRALVASANLDTHSFDDERNYGVLTTDWQDIEDLGVLFEADWSGTRAADACTRLVVSPENAPDRVLALLRSANTSIDVEAMYVSDSRVLDELIFAHQRGVGVRVLLNHPSFGVGDPADARRLAEAGIDVRHSVDLFIHAKLLVVDGRRALVGSQNFSWNSLERNREVAVVVDAPERLAPIFAADFGAGLGFQ